MASSLVVTVSRTNAATAMHRTRDQPIRNHARRDGSSSSDEIQVDRGRTTPAWGESPHSLPVSAVAATASMWGPGLPRAMITAECVLVGAVGMLTVGTGTPPGAYGFRPHVATRAASLTGLLRRHHLERGAGCGHLVGPAAARSGPSGSLYRTVPPDSAGRATGQEVPVVGMRRRKFRSQFRCERTHPGRDPSPHPVTEQLRRPTSRYGRGTHSAAAVPSRLTGRSWRCRQDTVGRRTEPGG